MPPGISGLRIPFFGSPARTEGNKCDIRDEVEQKQDFGATAHFHGELKWKWGEYHKANAIFHIGDSCEWIELPIILLEY